MLATASTAHALERGDSCTLKAPLVIKFTSPAGTVETTLDVGALVDVVGVSDGGSARVRSGDVKGDVLTAELHSACAGTLRTCRLTSSLLMYEQNRSDSQSWRIKVGADVSVLETGSTWAAVRIGDLSGFVKADEMNAACLMTTPHVAAEGGVDDIASEAIDRSGGPGVLLLPFALEGTASARAADALAEVLFQRCAFYRPDAARLVDGPARGASWKEQIALAAQRARAADTAYVVVGRLAMEPPPAVLQLGVVEAKTGKVLKAIRIRPTTNPEDNWADKALTALLPALAAAPGSTLPNADVKPGFEVAPVHFTDAAPAPKSAAPLPADEASWMANPWGWLALGSAAALGTGGGIVGVLAFDESTRANAPDAALAAAITAGALGVAATGALITGVVVFTTRAGLDP